MFVNMIKIVRYSLMQSEISILEVKLFICLYINNIAAQWNDFHFSVSIEPLYCFNSLTH